MTALEERLTAALAERADAVVEAPGSWARNEQLLQQRSAPTAVRRYRAPLLVAAAVLILIASVVAVRSLRHTAGPASPPAIGNSDGGGCRFGSMPGASATVGSLIYAPVETSGGRLIMLAQQAGAPNACFFDGVGWHYVAGTPGTAGSPVQILQASTADGQSWLWGLMGPGNYTVQIRQTGGTTSTLSVSGSDTLGGPFIVPVNSSGTVTLRTSAGRVVTTRSFDLAMATSATGPVVKQTSTPNSTTAGGQAIACPAGEADATAVQPVPHGAAVSFGLHDRGAVGQPVICASGGLTPIAAVITSIPDVGGTGFSHLGAMVVHNVDSTPRLWGVLPDQVATMVITTGEGVGTSTFVADPTKAVDGAVAMSKLGSYRTFAAVAGLAVGGSRFQLYADDGTLITSFTL